MRKQYSLLLLLLFTSSLSFGQRNLNRIDSISNLLSVANSDSLIVRHHMELGILKDTSNPLEAEVHLKTAITTLKTSYYYSDRLEKMALAYDCLGIIERRRNNYDQALKYYINALEIKETTKDSNNIGRSYHNIAMLFSANRNYDKAINYMQKALPIRKKDSTNYAVSLNNYGYFLYHKKKYEKALAILDSAKRYYGKDIRIADANNNIARIYKKKKLYIEALEIQKRNALIYSKNEKLERLANTYRDLAITTRKLKQYSEASKYQDSSEKIAQNYGNKKLIAIINKERYRVAKVKKQYKIALEYYQTYKKYEDSVFNNSQSEKIKAIELNYNYSKKTLTDSLNYEAKKTQLTVQNKSQRLQKQWYAILFCVTTIAMIGFIFAYRYQKRINIQNIQKQELEANLLNERILFLRYKVERLLTDNKMRSSFNKELTERLKTLRKSDNTKIVIDEYQSILIQLKNQLQAEKRLDSISESLQKTNEDFEQKLAKRFPQLSKSEREICHLIYLNLSTKEIMNARNMTLPSIKSIRYRIRKKILVPKGQELELFIKQLFN